MIYSFCTSIYKTESWENMKHKLAEDINNYIDYLNSLGLCITVHGKGISGLLTHNVHQNPFCTYVKTDPAAWAKCIREQREVFTQHKKGCLFGMCYAGVEEYVYFATENVFVSVGGYGIHPAQAAPRLQRVSRLFGLQEEILKKIYEEGLKHTVENEEKLSVLIKPLCHMIALLQLYVSEAEFNSSGSSLFDSILQYIQMNFMQDISIFDIAYACSCSASTVSHLFKQHTGSSVKSYVTKLRIDQAQKLLETSDLPVNRIAALCGFENTDYFSTVFKKSTGTSPKEYRKRK